VLSAGNLQGPNGVGVGVGFVVGVDWRRHRAKEPVRQQEGSAAERAIATRVGMAKTAAKAEQRSCGSESGEGSSPSGLEWVSMLAHTLGVGWVEWGSMLALLLDGLLGLPWVQPWVPPLGSPSVQPVIIIHVK